MKRRIISFVLVIFSLLLLTGCQMSFRAVENYQSPSTYEELRINMIKTVEPSVLIVKTETGHGSGIVFKVEDVDGSGLKRYYALTNYHVIEDGGEMYARFGGPETDIAIKDVKGYELYDIAIVRFETTKDIRVHEVKPINENTVQEIVKGQDVYAIGTPQKIDKYNYVTQGVVSLPSYEYNGVSGLSLMHDAELNPGNSGGPLFNLNGDLIGINVAKVTSISSKDGVIAAEGLNYSLNINKLAPMIRQMLESNNYNEVVRKPRLGISVQEVSVFLEENEASLLPANPVGVVVVGFDETRFAKDHLELYDLIYEMNGTPITSIADIAAQLANANFGDNHTLKVYRKVGSDFVSFTVTFPLS
jgi:serine protease Do